MALIAQLVEHCTGNAKVMGSNPVQSLEFFQIILSVVLWLHSHLSFFDDLIATVGHLLPSCPHCLNLSQPGKMQTGGCFRCEYYCFVLN